MRVIRGVAKAKEALSSRRMADLDKASPQVQARIREVFGEALAPSQEPDPELVHALCSVDLHPVAGFRDALDADTRNPLLQAVCELKAQVWVLFSPNQKRRHVDLTDHACRFERVAPHGCPIVVDRCRQRAWLRERFLVRSDVFIAKGSGPLRFASQPAV